jgi:hypothetical protein
MADKDTNDTHKVTTPKVSSEFSHPNMLDELLEDLDSYEKLSKDLKMNSLNGDRMKTEKHSPEKELPDLLKNSTDDKKLPLENIRENNGEKLDSKVKKEVEKVHKDAPNAAIVNIALDEFEAFLKLAKG